MDICLYIALLASVSKIMLDGSSAKCHQEQGEGVICKEGAYWLFPLLACGKGFLNQGLSEQTVHNLAVRNGKLLLYFPIKIMLIYNRFWTYIFFKWGLRMIVGEIWLYYEIHWMMPSQDPIILQAVNWLLLFRNLHVSYGGEDCWEGFFFFSKHVLETDAVRFPVSCDDFGVKIMTLTSASTSS